MTDRPIIFSAPMVRAILEGRKTQTRRVLKLPHNNPLGVWEATTVGGPGVYTGDGQRYPERAAIWHTRTGTTIAPAFAVGDRLWVREAWRTSASIDDTPPRDMFPRLRPVSYEADYTSEPNDGCRGRLRPSIHMPRWASRITLEVTAVKIERLQDISAEDAVAEGVTIREKSGDFWVPGIEHPNKDFPYLSRSTPREMFAALWDTVNGSGAWGANPWVVAITFERAD